MSQPYIIRRDGQDYHAPDLETLRRWAQEGRVLPTDLIYSPTFHAWYRAHDLRALRDVLPRPSVAPPPAATARSQQFFWLRKGEDNYRADDLETVLRWAEEGNIEADDFIFHPSYGKWFRAGDSPQLVSRFPPHIQRQPPFLPASADPMQSLGAPIDPALGAPTLRDLQPAVRRSNTGRPGTVEAADSMAKTVMDMRAADVVRALEAERGTERPRTPTQPPAGAEARRVEAERARPSLDPRAGVRPAPAASFSGTAERTLPGAVRPVERATPAAAPTRPTPASAPRPASGPVAPRPPLPGDASARPRPPEPARKDERPAESERTSSRPLSGTVSAATPNPDLQPARPASSADASAAARPASGPVADAPAARAVADAPAARPTSGAVAAPSPRPEPVRPLAADGEPLDATQPLDSPASPVAAPEPATSRTPPADVRFVDRLGLMKPFYDFARVFVVTRDMRPGELLETSCRMPGVDEDFLGTAKRAIFHQVGDVLTRHLEDTVRPARARLRDDELPGYERMLERAAALVALLTEGRDVIGRKPPERVVIGNQGRPKMTPEEEQLITKLDKALKALISVKAKGEG